MHVYYRMFAKREKIELVEDDSEVIGLLYTEGTEPLVVLASAYDKFGRSKQNNLIKTLAWGLLAGIAVTIFWGYILPEIH